MSLGEKSQSSGRGAEYVIAQDLANEQADRRFELRRLLGSGGMGVVYEAFDRERERVVALKVLRQLEPASVARFKREFRSLARVNHPNLVRLHELLSVDERWLYTMEYIDGVHLTDFVRGDAGGRSAPTHFSSVSTAILSAEETCATGAMQGQVSTNRVKPTSVKDLDLLRKTAAELAVAVDALHRTGHLHRDLKPSNVLIDRDGRVVLLDFGVIGELGAHEREVIGTPTYMAPEQFIAGSAHTPATDWYAFGCVLYHLLTGVRPFVGDPRDISFAKQNHDAVDPRELVAGIPTEVADVCVALLKRDPADRPHGDEVHRALVGEPLPRRTALGTRRAAATLVGRKRHLAVLCNAFDRVKRGRGASVMIRGRSGMGKSALVRAFLADVRKRTGVIVLEGRCHERESVPFKGIDGLVDALTSRLSDMDQEKVATMLPRDVASVERAFPALGAVPAILAARAVGGAPPQEPLEIRRRAFAGLLALFDALAREATLIVVIDDLQWGDSDTAPFLADLIGGSGPPALFVGCYRDDAGSSEVVDLISTASAEPVRVGRLSMPDAAALAESFLAELDIVDFDLARRVARESSGVPFLVEELARYLALHGVGSATLDGLTAEKVIQARVSSLDEGAQKLLALVAIAGQPIRRGALEEAAGLGSEFFEDMAALEDANLVSAMGTGVADLVETYHDRIRDSVVATIPEALRRHYHLVMALVLESTGTASHEDSLRHFAAAGEMGRAAEHALEAGDIALRALAFERAAHCYRLALAYHPTIDRADIETRLGDALIYAGRSIEGAGAYVRAAGAATNLGEARRLRVRAAAELMRGGAIDDGIAVLSAVLSDLGAANHSRARIVASLLLKRTQIWFRRGRFTPRTEDQIDPELLARIDATWQVASVFGAVDPLRGLEIQSRHMLLALDAGDPIRVSQAFLAEAALQSLAGRKAESSSLATVERSHELDKDAVPAIMGWRSGVRGLVHYQAGRWGKALPWLESSESYLRTECSGVPWEASTAQMFMLWTLYYLGRVAEVERRRITFHREATERGDLYGAVSLSVGFSMFGAVAQGRTSEVRAQVRDALQKWSVSGFHLQHYWAGVSASHCDLYDGEPRDAFERLERLWGDARRAYLLKVQALRVEFLHLRGSAALATEAALREGRGRYLAKAQKVVRALRRERVNWADGYAAALSAGLAAAQGDRPRASALLDQAANEFAGAGMALTEASARWQRGALTEKAGDVADAQAAAQVMEELGVVDPSRISAMLVPIFPR